MPPLVRDIRNEFMRKCVIDPKFEEFRESLADLHHLKQVVSQAFRREFESLDRLNDLGSPGEIVSLDAFIFDNPFTGQSEKYAFRKSSVDDLKQLTYWHKNSQYCWLLMSAYEKFETFLKFSYSESTGKPPPRDLNTMLCYFSNTFDGIKIRETKNHFKIDLRFTIHLVEKMRHSIVHDQGVLHSLEIFTGKICKDSGINGNKRLYEEFVSQFVFNSKVFILEVPTNNHPIIKSYHDQYRLLVSYLIAYASLIKDAAW